MEDGGAELEGKELRGVKLGPVELTTGALGDPGDKTSIQIYSYFHNKVETTIFTYLIFT